LVTPSRLERIFAKVAAMKGYKLSVSLQKALQKFNKKAVTDTPARRESMPKIVPIRRPYNDNTGLSSFV